MTALTLLDSLFHYKASIDEELLDALKLIEAEAHAESFRSALRVLNHAHIVDCIFASNLQKEPHAYTASWSKDAPALADLASAIREIDGWYLDLSLIHISEPTRPY